MKLNLSEIFQTKVPNDDGLRIALAQDIVDKIVANTKAGDDRFGGRLHAPYSPKYAKSLDFLAYGKNKNKINMTLTGSMLDAIQVQSITDDEITIGFAQTTQSEKAHGHITGAVSGEPRDFFGLPDGQLETIVESYQDEVDDLIEDEKPEQSLLELFILEQLARARERNKIGQN